MTFLLRLPAIITEPLFWLLLTLFASGIEEIIETRRGIMYVSKRRRLTSAILQILMAVVVFWYYWLRLEAPMRLIRLYDYLNM